MTSNVLRFAPWQGSSYLTGTTPLGARLLILGESHYSDVYQAGDALPLDFTQGVIQELGIEGSFTYFTKLRRLISDAALQPELGAEEFWQAVAFSNYIQDIVGEGARIAPAGAMWQRAADTLNLIVQETNPDAMLVVGARLWDNIPNDLAGLAFLRENSSAGEKWQLSIADTGRKIPVAYVAHPASRGWSYDTWTPVVAELLAAKS